MRARNLIIAGAAALVLGVSITAGVLLRHAVDPSKSEAESETQFSGEEQVSARPMVKFTLSDVADRVVTEADFRGRWTLVFFGFTRCPDVCPLSLLYASDLLQSLGLLAESLQIVFITVDPGRDTADVLLDYLTNFDPRIVGLRGTGEQTKAVTKAFGAYYAIRSAFGADGEPYNVDHSTAFYLVDPNGRLQRAFALKQNEPELMTKEIRETIFTSPKE